MKRKSSEYIPDILIFIPVHNEEQTLAKTLENIALQRVLCKAHISTIICLDGSTDGSLAIAEEWAAKDTSIHIINSPEKRGVSYHINKLFSLSQADMIMRIDADTVYLSHGLIRDMALAIEAGAGVVGVNYKHSPSPHSFLRKVDALGFSLWEAAKKHAHEKALTYHVVGSCVAWSKEVYSSIEIPGNGRIEEDTYITLKALEHGLYVQYIANAYSITEEKIGTFFELIKRYARHMARRYEKHISSEIIATKRPSLMKEFIATIPHFLIKNPIYITTYLIAITCARLYGHIKKSDHTW